MKKIDDMVFAYIKEKRTFNDKSNLGEEQFAKIKGIYDDCISAILKKMDAEMVPSLIVCNTYNKYSAVLPIQLKNNKHRYYILYDHHLNEINQILNAIYFAENDAGHDIWKIAYQLFEEDALIGKDEILLSYYGLNKKALGPFDVNSESKSLELIDRIQTQYIIGHELGHWVYKCLNNEENDDYFNIDFGVSWHALLADIKTILIELYMAYENTFKDKDYVELICEQRNIITDEKSQILEECFADAMSYAIVFSCININYGDDIEKKLLAGQALFLEIMNLQLLAMQQMTVSEEALEERFESSVSIRLGLLRNYVGLYFDDEKNFDEMLENTVNRYESRITIPILECFNELENRAQNIYNTLGNVDEIILAE